MNPHNNIHQANNNLNNNLRTFKGQFDTLSQDLNLNRHFFFPLNPRITAAVMHSELLRNRTNVFKPTNMRNLLRFFVRLRANSIQITDERVISRCTDLLILSSSRQEKLDYKNLSDEVNNIITSLNRRR